MLPYHQNALKMSPPEACTAQYGGSSFPQHSEATKPLNVPQANGRLVLTRLPQDRQSTSKGMSPQRAAQAFGSAP